MVDQSQLVSKEENNLNNIYVLNLNSLYLFALGSRITTIFNFGYVSLNILHLRAEDAGSYTVKAVNRLGEAISSATLRVFGKLLRLIIK